MSKYTTELRWVVEQTLDDMSLSHDESNWPKCWKVLGLDDYPIFDETHRDELNVKIVRHYYTREICSETVGRWRMFMRDAMHSMMPYYNQLYESELKVKNYNFMNDRDLTITQSDIGSETEGKTGTSKQVDSGDTKTTTDATQDGKSGSTTEVDTNVTNDSTNTSTSTDTSVFSDTPQSEMIPDEIKQMKYASSVTIDQKDSSATAHGTSVTDGTTKVNATDTTTANGTEVGTFATETDRTTSDDRKLNTTDELARSEVGVLSSRSNLLKQWRETMLNIDQLVINDRELRECFLMVW